MLIGKLKLDTLTSEAPNLDLSLLRQALLPSSCSLP